MAPAYTTEYDAGADLGTINVLHELSPGANRSDTEDPAVSKDIQFQHGTIPENGVNGVTNESVLDLLAMRLRTLNQRSSCRENSLAITHIETARLWLNERTANREVQGVEGTHAPHEEPLGS